MRFHGAVQCALNSQMRFDWIWQVFAVTVIAWCCDGLPTTIHRFKRSPPVDDNVQNYLGKYGYLALGNSEIASSLRTEDQLQDAIRSLQAFGNIPVTGVLDKDTMQLLGRPRCGIADVVSADQVRKKRYTLQGQRWSHTNITWSLQTRQVQGLDYYMVRDALEKALNVWSKHIPLTFVEMNSHRADISISFGRFEHGDKFPFDGRGKVLAHAFFPEVGIGGDAHFDEDEQWTVGEDDDKSQGTSLFAVAAHEFGHSLGLSHSSVVGSLMYPWYQGFKPNSGLPDDDREAVQILYGKKPNYDRYYPPVPPRDPYTTPTTPRRDPYKPTSTPARTPYRPPPPPKTEPPYKPATPRYTPRHHNHLPPVTKPSYNEPGTTKPPYSDVIPNGCDTSFDAVTMFRGDWYLFKDEYVWRVGDQGLYRGFPHLIKNLWPRLPDNLTHVDAVYERYDQNIVFFIGREVYMYRKGNTLVAGFPRLLTDLKLPWWLDHIDAAMVWGYNGKTYFFSGYQYWRFDEEMQVVELDYPRNMSIWKGVGTHIDAAFQWKDGKTYFFKGKGFWKFNDPKLSVYNKTQQPSAFFVKDCPKSLMEFNALPNNTDANAIHIYDLQPSGFFVTYQNVILVVSIIISLILLVGIIVMIRKRNNYPYTHPKLIKR